MSTMLVAKFRNKKDADKAVQFLKTLRGKMRLMRGENWDDFIFGQMIEEGVKEKKEVPVEKVHKLLRK
jgi:hypothetical protein